MSAESAEVTVENTGESYTCPPDSALLDAALVIKPAPAIGRFLMRRTRQF